MITGSSLTRTLSARRLRRSALASLRFERSTALRRLSSTRLLASADRACVQQACAYVCSDRDRSELPSIYMSGTL